MTNELNDLNNKFKSSNPEEILNFCLKKYKNKIAFASSLGAEDQVLTEMIVNTDKDLKIFTLDTGRMFNETYRLIDRTNNKYNIKINVIFPDYNEIEAITKEKGMNFFYESVEDRKLCCKIRKTNPLKRALKDVEVWITGLRKEQSVTRTTLNIFEWDETHNIIKINPLANWTEKQVWDYIKNKDIPYNVLHDKGFLSIGCAPCTRAVNKGEDIRAGRWWWENPENKECGLHSK